MAHLESTESLEARLGAVMQELEAIRARGSEMAQVLTQAAAGTLADDMAHAILAEDWHAARLAAYAYLRSRWAP